MSWPIKQRLKFQGLDISIENPKGSVRRWYDPHGKETGHTKMHFAYGYIRRTKGTDGDHVDVYVGPNSGADTVYIVNQMKKPPESAKNDGQAWTKFDEQKCMLGFDSAEAAKAAYLKQYDDPRFFGSMKTMAFDTFKEKVLDKANHGKKVAMSEYDLDILTSLKLAGENLEGGMLQARPAYGQKQDSQADRDQKKINAGEKTAEDKTAVSPNWIYEHASQGLGKRGLRAKPQDLKNIAAKAVSYGKAKAQHGVGGAGQARKELKDVLTGLKGKAKAAPSSGASGGSYHGSSHDYGFSDYMSGFRRGHEAGSTSARETARRVAEEVARDHRSDLLATASGAAGLGVAGGAYLKDREYRRKQKPKPKETRKAASLSDRIDDTGIGVLAAPYAADVASKGLLRVAGQNPKARAAAMALKHGLGTESSFGKSHARELAGLALVAPAVTKGVAKGVEKMTPEKKAALETFAAQYIEDFEYMAEPDKLAALEKLAAAAGLTKEAVSAGWIANMVGRGAAGAAHSGAATGRLAGFIARSGNAAKELRTAGNAAGAAKRMQAVSSALNPHSLPASSVGTARTMPSMAASGWRPPAGAPSPGSTGFNSYAKNQIGPKFQTVAPPAGTVAARPRARPQAAPAPAPQATAQARPIPPTAAQPVQNATVGARPAASPHATVAPRTVPTAQPIPTQPATATAAAAPKRRFWTPTRAGAATLAAGGVLGGTALAGGAAVNLATRQHEPLAPSSVQGMNRVF